MKLPNPSQAIYAPIRDEEQNGKQKKEKERNRERVPNPAAQNHSSQCINAEERGKKRKGIEANRVKTPAPSQAIDALTGDEEQNGKQKRPK